MVHFIPTSSIICNLVIVYSSINNQFLPLLSLDFSPWLFDTILTDNLYTFVFFYGYTNAYDWT
jgi:hypothetical protein